MTAPNAAAAPAFAGAAGSAGAALEPALLAWFGDTAFPDGADDAPPLSQAAWEATYARLGAAARAPGLLAPLFVLEAPLAGVRPDGVVPIGVIDVPVARADAARARRAAERAFGHDLAVDAASLVDGAQPARAFAASALLHAQWGRDVAAVRGRDVAYALDERFWVALPAAARPDAIALDPGDGAGPRDVALGATPVRATYAPGLAQATVTLRARYGDETRTARFTVPIDDAPAAPAPDATWPLAATAPDGTAVSGRACVYLGAGHADVVHPVVMCEGFPGGYAPDYMYDMLNQAGLADALRARGQDLVVLHYAAGAGPIQHNAHLLVACLAEVRRRISVTPAEAGIVVGGVSMGGLVSRYALAWMETHGVDHGARAFLTIDTPHLGAYTVVADQWLAKFLAAASPLAAMMAGALDSPANQQFVMRWLRGGRVAPSPERGAFLADLRAVGDWPRAPRRLAVASGHGRGADADPTRHAGERRGRRLAMSLDGAPFAEVRLYTLPDAGATAVVGEGRCAVPASGVPNALAVTSDLAWEDVPGGTNDYTAQAAGIARALACGPVTCDVPRCCSVPTVSALALDQDPRSPVPPPSSGRSPFHDYVCSAENEPHVTITAEVAAWILDRLGTPPIGEPDMTATARPEVVIPAAPPTPAIDPARVNLHDPAFNADPYPTYAAMRRSAPIATLAPYGTHWVFRHADVLAALNDTATFPKHPASAAPPTSHGVLDALGALPPGVFSSDPPRHTNVRGALEPPLRAAFAGAALIAGAIADDRIHAIRAGRTRRVELMAGYATDVPSHTLFALLGLPAKDFPQLVKMVTAIALANDPTQSLGVQAGGGVAAMALYAYCQGMVAAAPPSSLLGQMCAAAAAADPALGPVDVQTSLVNFIVAGYLSTTFLIGTGILNLLAHPEQLARLRADPSLIDAAVREMLRHDAPAQVVDRVAATDTTLGGVALPAGTPVTLVLGSANRDETVFADPDRFEIGRADADAAIPFGAGIHHCIGAPLVRIVAPLAIGRFVAAFPDLALAGTVQWQTDPYLRAPANVPLSI